MEPRTKNLSKEEKTALKGLIRDKSITFKGANKGGATVILDTKDYIAEAERQLSDTHYYCPLDCDLTPQYNTRIDNYLRSLHKKGTLSKTIFDRLLTPSPRTPAWYHNPKVHKPNTHLGIPPGRPIVSVNGCVTEKITSFLDICLNQVVPHTPSYVKDPTSYNWLNNTPTQLPFPNIFYL